MEIAGLAIGVPGVIGPLIQAGLNGYKIFSAVQNLNTDFDRYQHQLGVQRKLLKDWAETLKCRVGKEFATDQPLDEFKGDQERLTLVIKTLTRVAYLFADVRRLDTLYGMKTVTFSDSTISDQGSTAHQSSSFRKMFRSIRSRSKSGTPDAPNSIDPNTQALENLKIDLGEDFIASLPVAEQFNRIVSSYDKAKWVFTDREKLQALVEDLKQYNSDLKNLPENYLFTIGDIGMHDLITGSRIKQSC
jgi:hypothetical protein